MLREYHNIPFGTYRCPHCNLEFDYYGSEDRVICPQCTFDLTTYAIPTPINAAVNPFTGQTGQQHNQELHDLREELDGLRHILASIVNQEGGTYRLLRKSRFFTKPDVELWFRSDDFDRCLIISTNDVPATKTEPRPMACNMPDWML